MENTNKTKAELVVLQISNTAKLIDELGKVSGFGKLISFTQDYLGRLQTENDELKLRLAQLEAANEELKLLVRHQLITYQQQGYNGKNHGWCLKAEKAAYHNGALHPNPHGLANGNDKPQALQPKGEGSDA